MRNFRRNSGLSILLGVALLVLMMAMVQAQENTKLDYGQLSGTPALANYVAWRTADGLPPTEVITEDSYNSAEGANGGYAGGFWLLQAGKLNNLTNGDQVGVVFGGLGSAAGTIWPFSFNWDELNDPTDHGTLSITAPGSCPAMVQGSLSGDQKTINWTGPVGYYQVYRSTLGSAGTSGQSNGDYEWVATVLTTSTNGSYVDTLPAGVTESWHIVVPSDASNNITGCHSEESNPNAVNLTTFRSAGVVGTPLMAFGAGALGMIALGIGLRRSRKSS